MTRAISRNSFNELKQYLGVHLQQGRVILDADWNEAQDILATLIRRLGQDALRDGVLNEGFDIVPVLAGPWDRDRYETMQHQLGLPFSLRFPQSAPLDALDSTDGWALSTTGKLRTSRDRPYEGTQFLRLSDYTGAIELTKTLGSTVDLATSQFAHFRFRVNQQIATPPPGTAAFFIEDASGNRNVFKMSGLGGARDVWAPGAALPLDLRYSMVDIDLPPAFRNQQYVAVIPTIGAPSSTVAWSFTGSLPTGLSITAGTPQSFGRLTGSPTTVGTFTFTLAALSNGVTVTKSFTLKVQDIPTFPQSYDATLFGTNTQNAWQVFQSKASKPTGTAANLSQIKKYGFQLFQQSPALTWDFDALYVGNRAQVKAAAANNFVISGPVQNAVIENAQQTILEFPDDDPNVLQLLSIIKVALKRDRTPRAYFGGIPCAQPREVLYSLQADPNDPALTTPTGTVRKDLVYLDVWREPVTYVEDPDLREIALGGPDTATRMRVRQRVRVAQGGTLPADDGTGRGLLATDGSYTDRANRLYLVEVDTAGDIGTATVRWSEDNGSTIQRVIETIPPGATKVKVEDASGFQPGDFILIRKELKDEEHRISSIFGNTITLQEPTGGTVTFAFSDRPKVQRWNAFHAPIVADSNDPTVSTLIDLSRGVKVKFGGSAFKKGDYWTFRARYLAGDEASGINPVSRIETVDFQPPQGVVHQFTPLALLIRDPTANEPDRINLVRDLRRRGGQVVLHKEISINISVNNSGGGSAISVPAGTTMLGATSSQSLFICLFNGNITPSSATVIDLNHTFFNNDMTDPAKTNTGAVAQFSTSITCEAAGTRARMAIATSGGTTGDQQLPVEFSALALTIPIPAGQNCSVVGTLQVLEIKNRIFSF